MCTHLIIKLTGESLSGVEDDEPLGPLLVHDPVAALPAPNGVPRPDLVLVVALAADVDHRRTRVYRHGADDAPRCSRSGTPRGRSAVHCSRRSALHIKLFQVVYE